MKKYKVYGIGAALVDTEIKVKDSDLVALGVEKGVMTLVEQQRQNELLVHLQGHLVTARNARHASLAAGNVVAKYGPRLPAEDHAALRQAFFGD